MKVYEYYNLSIYTVKNNEKSNRKTSSTVTVTRSKGTGIKFMPLKLSADKLKENDKLIVASENEASSENKVTCADDAVSTNTFDDVLGLSTITKIREERLSHLGSQTIKHIDQDTDYQNNRICKNALLAKFFEKNRVSCDIVILS